MAPVVLNPKSKFVYVATDHNGDPNFRLYWAGEDQDYEDKEEL